MPTVYITRGTRISKTRKRLIVTKDEDKIADLPLINVDQVVVFGNISITGAIIQSLLQENIPITYLSYYGKYRGRLTPKISSNSTLRLKQFEAYKDEKISLELSKQIAVAKIFNMRTFLMKSTSGARSENAQKSVDQMKNILDKLNTAANKDSLRGYEGTSAKYYFGVFDEIIDDEFEFNGRNRQPPRDPVNSLLSFGYTLLLNDMMTAINVVGLDPYIGFFHSVEQGKPTLALDLIEEFRQVIIDAVVKSVINKRMIKQEHFDIDEDKVLISDEGRKIFLEQYEERMGTKLSHSQREESVTWRKAMELQVGLIKEIITGQREEYQAVKVR
ncbi:MAG: CRISPR-associated endonuclease Cas1 [Bacillota bacterium]